MKKIEKIKSYYEPKFQKNYPEFKIQGWESQTAQFLRFEALISNVELDGKKLLDVGCGLGNLLEYLISKNIDCDYTGVDINEKMIELAKAKKLPGKFFLTDIFDKCPFEPGSFDVVYSSGIFNLDLGNNKEFLQKAMKLFANLSCETVVISLLHHKSPAREEPYYYFVPEEVEQMARSVPTIKRVSIIEQYLKNDFTVICEK